MNEIHHQDNLEFLLSQPDEKYDLIYIDPPFNTGKKQKRKRIKTVAAKDGDRQGFGGKTYKTETAESPEGYEDRYTNFIDFMSPRLVQAHRVLKRTGSIFVHLDFREVHYIKAHVLDTIFGTDCFMNEIIWAYDFGARSKKKWPAKHDTILWYVKDPEHYYFDEEEAEMLEFVAPQLDVGDEPLGDVWWHTIVGTNSKEKTGYPTQKPLGILRRIIKVHSKPGDLCLDFFAGSGALGEAAAMSDRWYVLVDSNLSAIHVMDKRLSKYIRTDRPQLLDSHK